MSKSYVKNLETGKIELHFEKSEFLALPEELKKELKRFYSWSKYSSAWVSKGVKDHYWALKVAEKLGFTECETKGQRLTFAEEQERKQERAEHRAERYEVHAANAEKRAQSLTADRERYRGDIAFWTQPVINSASGRSFARYRERVMDRYMKGLDEYRKSEYFQEQAERLHNIADASQIKSPVYLNNRIEETERDIRALNRALDKAEKQENETWKNSLLGKLEYQIDKLAYWKNCMDQTAKALEEAGKKLYTKEDLKPGYLYRPRHFWWAKVIKVNPKTVSGIWIEGPMKGLDTSYPYAEITEVKIPEDWTEEVQKPENPFKLGDIVGRYNADHSNLLRAWQVVKTTDKTVTIRQIGIKDRQALKDQFISEELERKTVKQDRSGNYVLNDDSWYLYRVS